MKYIRKLLSVRQEKELEILKADNAALSAELEKQNLLTRYVAEMSDIFIPEEETEDEYVQNSFENEENV